MRHVRLYEGQALDETSRLVRLHHVSTCEGIELGQAATLQVFRQRAQLRELHGESATQPFTKLILGLAIERPVCE